MQRATGGHGFKYPQHPHIIWVSLTAEVAVRYLKTQLSFREELLRLKVKRLGNTALLGALNGGPLCNRRLHDRCPTGTRMSRLVSGAWGLNGLQVGTYDCSAGSRNNV